MPDDDLLLRGFTICQVMDCIADPTKNRVIAELWDRVDGVFPYLNAVLPGVMYNPGADSLTVKRGPRILTFHPHLAVMAKVDERRTPRPSLAGSRRRATTHGGAERRRWAARSGARAS